jgi:hypothetical protein
MYRNVELLASGQGALPELLSKYDVEEAKELR